ncbi:MAG: hypothetical protein MJA82_20120 [Clostridia bacterium]|nr:hypothetical protein [Clostridia bacterium]
MVISLEKIKSLATMYMLLLTVGSSLFIIFIDYKALKKKKLNKEARVCKFIGYLYLVGGLTFFITMRYVY